jgi:uncharacterized protein YecE (DUF72 family)
MKIGTAGWTIGSAAAGEFPIEGSGLQRYSRILPVTEINSSFHRPHRKSTWERWYESVPAAFRFSVKIPKEISHERKLVECDEPLAAFLDQAHCLREKLAILLLQLPPKFQFEANLVERFCNKLAARTSAAVVCEPRNATWFTGEADELLKRMKVARVAADPASTPAAASPGGWKGLSYWRLHGSPVIYRSSYADRIRFYADRLIREMTRGRECWCIFDNTASSAAISDALLLREALNADQSRSS